MLEPPVIIPTPLLRRKEVKLTQTHVCYASLVLKSKDYAEFYRRRSLEGDIVVLDHSPVLPRNPLDIGRFIEVIDYIHPKAVVLPDKDFSKDRTIGLADSYFQHTRHLRSIRDLPTIGVLQGTSLEEIDLCLQWMKERVKGIGLHSGLENILPRNQLMTQLDIRYPAIYIEVHKDIYEETPKSKAVDLLWTSMPARLAYQGRKISSIYPTPPELNFTEGYFPPLLKTNIEDYIYRMKVGRERLIGAPAYV